MNAHMLVIIAYMLVSITTTTTTTTIKLVFTIIKVKLTTTTVKPSNICITTTTKTNLPESTCWGEVLGYTSCKNLLILVYAEDNNEKWSIENSKKSSITTTTTITQKPTTNTKAPTTSKSQPTQNGNCLGKYQQCEGINYSVPIYCEPENTCMFFGEQYSILNIFIFN
ncbi:hypothetical protein H8356DRAFT_1304036 [Neocallimastix lanati (nom. inval.)]|uniref:CBM10 domain-containing protein n=1 Tax=Neocallimastix californiae TaxID=1754190 RepID=A0A1Y2AF39_9FUNG|nr:hypothetical protein H8356DRAFT_1304036 [Neocallimastix sp. JGI-2020a]ORY20890.1 hypothetical protein LY90DRAFT_633197 [Neocallimastix californiae]|eukprot:ORY20890.1 hypothetical protein LY90DRAFT_633197 [Neocallimastix californiae]